MTAMEITRLIEETLSALPERMSGNEAYPQVAIELRGLMATDRKSVIEALRAYLAFRVPQELRQPEDAVREARLWMSRGIAEMLLLIELRPDIELLVVDVRNGRVLLPIHEGSVAGYLRSLVV